MVIPRYPSFNVFSTVSSHMTALGPVCVATSISKLPGWDVEIVDENNYRQPGPVDDGGLPDHAALQSLRPADAVGFYGGLSCTIPRLFELAKYYSEWGAFTIGGGQHLDFRPREALENGLTVVVHGEGEQTACKLLECWQLGLPLVDIAGTSMLVGGELKTAQPREPIQDFEAEPLPDFGLLRFAHVKIWPVGRTRGCGMNCEFCSVKGRARSASPERLLAQIACLTETYNARRFFVVDDHFAQHRRETIRFCQLLEEYQQKMGIRLRLGIQIRLECGQDDELLSAMRRAGVWFVAIGLESPVDEELAAMNKRIKASDMVKLVRGFHRYDFYIHGMFIFGYPMQPGSEFTMSARERVRRFKRFFRQARLDTVQVLTPVPIPGSQLRVRLEQAGRVLSNDEIGWEYYDGNFPLIVPDKPLTPASIHHSILQLMSGFYGFNRLLGVMGNALRFPFAMMPMVDIRNSFKRWRRSWFNDVIGSTGYFIVRNWKRAYREGPFHEKLDRVYKTQAESN